MGGPVKYSWIKADQLKVLVKDICALAQTKKIHTTPSNGARQCFNAALINMIGTLLQDDKKDWVK